MNRIATAVNTTESCPENCMCDECLELSNRPTLVPSTNESYSASKQYERILQEYSNIEDQIDPLWDLLTDSSAVISKELEAEIVGGIVSIEGILRQKEERRNSQVQSTAVDDALQQKHAQKKKPAKSVPTQRASERQLLRHRNTSFDTPESNDDWNFDDDTYATWDYEMDFDEGHRIQKQLLQQPLIEKRIRHSLVSTRRNKQAIYENHRANTGRGPKPVSKPKKMEKRRTRRQCAQKAA